MTDRPSTFEVPATLVPSRYDHHVRRRLSSMRGQFHDAAAYERLFEQEDRVLYEVYELERPDRPGELRHGVSIVHPGRVGEEFFMTKGHFHSVIDTAEIYYCLGGQGQMVMETPDGDWAVEELRPGRVLYVPPRWAHRSVNTGAGEDLVTFFVYPGNAGHDYGAIERQGFRKLVVARPEGPAVIDNPRWLSPKARR
ncbi:MAG: glucose-6-phosphate isomerase [candidate division NC10 bacterium RIFCSPLOWO2_12_FULL_66_18]|nr:MAG: glucose-6-phosphate isomerase [candidate division NC10 bacterium RIFCSPLOWO2_12_FULL_66_18]